MSTVTFTVAANGDDWHSSIDGSTKNASFEGAGATSFVAPRSLNTDAGRVNAGWRCTAVGGTPAGLKGATINSAIPTLYVTSTTRDDARLNFYGVAEDDPAGWSAGRRPLATDVTFTTANVAWVAGSVGTGAVAGPDIKTVIQELVNRAGFTDASHIAIVGAGQNSATDNDIDCLAFESGTGTYFKIDIDYTPSTTPSPYAVRRQQAPLN